MRGCTLLGVLAVCLLGLPAGGQEEDSSKSSAAKTEPKYDDTFSGPVVEFSADKITVSRSILGRPAEKRTFLIKPDTRIEGRLRVKARVTVGFVTTDDGDVARLIVVRTTVQRPPQEKK
ncbi:MAG TPA: hypothetical protein VEV17_15755 [Bryobacteraceae bacterium]|nr:hypothetical protein [Bryobacteraceae bacterium]